MSAADDTLRMLAGLIEATRIVPQSLRAAPGSLPLTVIGGFLGAGKTTLVNRLLVEPHGLRLAVLVNDFGRINIDAALVRSRTADTIALTNGCACCSISGDLTRALVDLAQRDDPPQAIVIEASGVADPRSLAQVALANPALRLDALVTIVDAETVFTHAADMQHGALFHSQVDAADVVVLNKRDLVAAESFGAARAWIETRAPGRPIVAASHADVPAEVLFGIASDRALDATPQAPAHANHFRTRAFESATPLDEATLLALVDAGDGDVIRAKGIVWLASAPERRSIFQRVGRRHTLVHGEPWAGEAPRSQVVVITKAA
jgi:G3E family GTPase